MLLLSWRWGDFAWKESEGAMLSSLLFSAFSVFVSILFLLFSRCFKRLPFPYFCKLTYLISAIHKKRTYVFTFIYVQHVSFVSFKSISFLYPSMSMFGWYAFSFFNYPFFTMLYHSCLNKKLLKWRLLFHFKLAVTNLHI